MHQTYVTTPQSPPFRYSLSIGWFFTEVPFLERFSLAKKAGFNAIEMFWPHEPPEALKLAKDSADVDIALINMYEGDYAAGDRGFACDPQRITLWREKLLEAVSLAEYLDCTRVNVLTGDIPDGVTRKQAESCFIANMVWAGKQAAQRNVILVIEPLTHLTHPHYLCPRTKDALDLIAQISSDNVALQYDLYHAQCSEGNLSATLTANIAVIQHIQIADVPTRAAPGTGEINFSMILQQLVDLSYDGYIGLEYNAPDPEEALRWLPQAQR